jgi:hypothetical protein
MHDVLDIIKNVEMIYDSNTSFQVLKDFERVLDELDIYVYANWEDGEIASGPTISRHWVTCEFMWPRDKMPDPMGGKRLLDYDCKVSYEKSYVLEPRKIKKPDDIRPGTKKGKLDRHPIWVVKIQMPKKLIADIYSGYAEMINQTTEPATPETVTPEPQTADAQVAGGDTGIDGVQV